MLRARNARILALFVLACLPTVGIARSVTEIIDVAGDGMGNTFAGGGAIAVDGSGNVYVIGVASDNAFRVTPDGVITQIIDWTRPCGAIMG